MAKCIIHKDAVVRLTNAAANGSKIASLILTDLANGGEMNTSKTANYFDTLRKKSGNGITVVFTCCTKDLTSDAFPDKSPDAMWRKENRIELSTDKFASMFPSCREAFKNGELKETDWQYLGDVLALPKLTIDIKNGYEHFFKGYLAENYSDFYTDSSLHNSCMRYADKAAKCADFYQHFAGCRILMVTDEDGTIYSRAIVWDNVTIEDKQVTMLDRVYYTNRGILTMVYKYVAELGFIRKEINSYDSKQRFCRFENDSWVNFSAEASLVVPVNDWHKAGAPYIDTLTYLFYDGKNLVLHNSDSMTKAKQIASFNSTGGTAELTGWRVCPLCGKAHRDSSSICDSCKSKSTFFEGVLVSKETVKVNGVDTPVEFLEKDKKTLKKFARLNSHIEKLSK